MSKTEGFMIIPSECPRFVAACATVGIGLQQGSPGITNVYTHERKYDPDEPGEVRYILSDTDGYSPLCISKAWRDPEQNLAEAKDLPSRILKCKTLDDWQKIASDLDTLHTFCGVAHMKLFSQNKFAVDSLSVSDEEELAAQFLSDLPAAMLLEPLKNKQRIAKRVEDTWPRAMFAWVKAWIGHYRASAEHWKHGHKAIKIDRGDDFPLIIPKGKDFERLMKRWVK
jgi:hypothetical protein